MSSVRVVYHLARADFLERVRQYGFLLVLAGTLYIGYAINRGDLYVALGGYSGVLNSAWVGGMVTASAVLLISLFGFYFVKNVIERDNQTGVGQIIATLPISRIVYCLGKWLSNWAVLSAFVGILAGAAVVMQAIGDDTSPVDFIALLLPFVLLAIPAMAFIAAVALFFETVCWLRGGFGNVLYFFFWTFALAGPFITMSTWMDWSGIVIVHQSMGGALQGVDPGYTGGFVLTWKEIPPGGLRTFLWTGIDWTADVVLSRLLWLGWSAGLVSLGSIFFHRFDPSLERKATKGRKQKGRNLEQASDHQSFWNHLLLRLQRVVPGGRIVREASLDTQNQRGKGLFGRIALPGFGHSAFFRVVRAEVRLMIKGQRWWWYAGAAVMIIGGLVSPTEEARQFWLPAAWLWPILLWSVLGTRAERFGMYQLVYSSPRMFVRQLPAAWLGGLFVTMLCGSGVGLNLLFSAKWSALGAWCAGAAFVPALALALGTWSQTNRLFEIVYVLIWYLGPGHPLDMPLLDFMGAADVSIAAGVPLVVGCAGGLLFMSAVAGHWVRLRL